MIGRIVELLIAMFLAFGLAMGIAYGASNLEPPLFITDCLNQTPAIIEPFIGV